MKPHLEITEDNLAAMEVFAESNEEPIVMVNLMQVRPHAEYEDPALNDCTGLEALARYTSVLRALGKRWELSKCGLAERSRCL